MGSVWCLILGHVRTRVLLDKEVGDQGWPCLETCLYCGSEWWCEIPKELLVGDPEDRDPGKFGPWEVWFCEGCGRGPIPLSEDPEVRDDRLCGICDRGVGPPSWYQR